MAHRRRVWGICHLTDDSPRFWIVPLISSTALPAPLPVKKERPPRWPSAKASASRAVRYPLSPWIFFFFFNNNNNCIQWRYSRCFTISSQRRELSPIRTLKWPGCNRVQITCNTSNAYHVQVSCYVPLDTKGQLSY